MFIRNFQKYNQNNMNAFDVSFESTILILEK